MPRRYEEEIEEILDRDERRARRSDQIRSVTQRVSQTRRGFRPSAGGLMLAGLAFVIAGLLVRSLFVPLAAIGALLFIAGYVAYFSRSSGPRYQKRWRGEIVDYPDSWPNRLRRFFRRR